MRDAFIATLSELARTDSRILLVTGDLGFGVLDAFAWELPRQYINAGVAEQGMTGIATGMALEGKVVFTYSIGNFPTLRCLEQIRNDVAYHDADVKVVAVGGGFSYGPLGMSHHATEDIAVLRAIPNVAVYAPCDIHETQEITRLLVRQPGPAYLRLDKSKLGSGEGDPFVPGALRRLRDGRDLAILVCGGIAADAMAAADALATHGIDAAVYSAHTLKPFDDEGLQRLAARHDRLVTVEEHVRTGGLGSIVAECLVDMGRQIPRLLRLSIPDVHFSVVGSQEYLRGRLGLDAAGLAAAIGKFAGLAHD